MRCFRDFHSLYSKRPKPPPTQKRTRDYSGDQSAEESNKEGSTSGRGQIGRNREQHSVERASKSTEEEAPDLKLPSFDLGDQQLISAPKRKKKG